MPPRIRSQNSLCSLRSLRQKQNGITAKTARTAKKEQPQNLSHSTPTYGPRRTTQAEPRREAGAGSEKHQGQPASTPGVGSSDLLGGLSAGLGNLNGRNNLPRKERFRQRLRASPQIKFCKLLLKLFKACFLLAAYLPWRCCEYIYIRRELYYLGFKYRWLVFWGVIHNPDPELMRWWPPNDKAEPRRTTDP